MRKLFYIRSLIGEFTAGGAGVFVRNPERRRPAIVGFAASTGLLALQDAAREGVLDPVFIACRIRAWVPTRNAALIDTLPAIR